MVSVIPYKRLLEETPNGRDDLFREKLKLDPSSVNGHHRVNQDGILYAAAQIYESALALNMPKHKALAQITPANIAALLCPWENPEAEVWSVGTRIAREFPDVESHINEIRRVVFERYHRKPLFFNIDQAVERWSIDYGDYDLKRGVKFPSFLGPREILLLGVYFATGSFHDTRNRFALGCTPNNIAFMRDYATKLIYATFNIETKIRERTRTKDSGFDGHSVTYSENGFLIESKAHYSFLTRNFRFYEERDETKVYAIPPLSNVADDMQDEEIMRDFFIGIIAGRGLINRNGKRGKNVLLFNNKNHTFLEGIKLVANNAGFGGEISIKSGSLQLRFKSETLEAIASEPSDPIYEEQRGLLINPAHLAILNRDYR